MPLASWDTVNVSSDTLPGQLPEQLPQPVVPAPGVLDTMSAALRQNNLATGLYEHWWNEKPLTGDQPGYDFSTDIAGYEGDAMRFARSGSPAETQRIKERIAQEEADKRTLNQAGGWGMAANFAAGAIDPVTLVSMMIPVAPELVGASRLARIGTGIASNAALDVGEETAFHNLQETRTMGESMLRVGAGALLTGAFGAIATRVPKSEFETMAADLSKQMKEVPDVQSIGAMRVGGGTTLADESIASSAGRAIAATIGRINPLSRLFRSGTKEARILTQELVDVPFALEKNLKGARTADSAETRILQRELQSRIQITNSFESAYARYRATKPENALTLRQFGRETAAALRRGDVHPIPEVAQLATETRKMFESDRQIFQELGVLPEDMDLVGAKSYFPRVYDHVAISQDSAAFKQKLHDWYASNPRINREAVDAEKAVQKLTSEHQDLAAQIKALGEHAEQSLHEQLARMDQKLEAAKLKSAQMAEKSSPMDPSEIDMRVHETYDRILGINRGAADLGHISNPKVLHARSLDVPDEILEPYLISDFEHVMQGYTRAVSPQIELRRTFGDTTLEKELKTIQDAYHVKAAKLTDNKAIQALDKEHAAVIEDIKALRDHLLGKLGSNANTPLWLVKSLRRMRAYNYTTKLGSQTLSSLSDYGHVVTRYGLGKTLAKTARFLTDIHANKMIREDAKRMGTALDWVIDTRSGTLADIGDELAGSRMVDRGVQWATNKFTRITGMATWNSAIKAITSALEQDFVLRAAQKSVKMTPYQLSKLAQNGIGAAELERMAKQFEMHGVNDGGLFRARTDAWTDRDAARLLEDSIVKSGNIMSIRRGAGDLPIFMNGEVARTLLQFKSFGMASVNRIMIPVAQGLSYHDAATLNGFLMMLALGGMTYATKEWAAGREPNLTPTRLAAESLNWSGVLGYLPDVMDPATGLLPPPLRGMRFSRYSDRTPIMTLMGPSLGAATNLYQTTAGVTDLGITQKDIHGIRRDLVPLQNVFYLRRLFNALEGEAGEAFNAEGATVDSFAHRITKTEKPSK